MCQVRDVPVSDDFVLFLIVGECIEDKRFVCLFVVDECSAPRCSCIHVTHGVGTYWRRGTWVSGVASWCKILGHHFSFRQLPMSRVSR